MSNRSSTCPSCRALWRDLFHKAMVRPRVASAAVLVAAECAPCKRRHIRHRLRERRSRESRTAIHLCRRRERVHLARDAALPLRLWRNDLAEPTARRSSLLGPYRSRRACVVESVDPSDVWVPQSLLHPRWACRLVRTSRADSATRQLMIIYARCVRERFAGCLRRSGSKDRYPLEAFEAGVRRGRG